MRRKLFNSVIIEGADLDLEHKMQVLTKDSLGSKETERIYLFIILSQYHFLTLSSVHCTSITGQILS